MKILTTCDRATLVCGLYGIRAYVICANGTVVEFESVYEAIVYYYSV